MASKLSLPDVFSNGMIIKCEVETAIWGQGPDGKQVRLQIDGRHVETVVSDGRWRVSLPALEAGGPYTLNIQCDGENLEIADILAGEVFIAGGQSNMEWALQVSMDFRKYIDQANYPQVRHFCVPRVTYAGEQKDDPEKFKRMPIWRKALPDQVGEFSAVAYHFARDLHESLGIPIGIIECNVGGSSAAAWVSEDYLRLDDDVKTYLDDFATTLERLDLDKYHTACDAVRKNILPEQASPDPEKEMDAPRGVMPGLSPEQIEMMQINFGPGPRSPFGHPSSLHNNMLLTIAPYTVSGVIFYQGESDDVKARIYHKLFRLMIQCWRDTLENPALPFFYVQLAAYSHDSNPDGEMFALVRDSQTKVARTVPHAYMAVAMDVGSFYDIHPRRKEPVGKRLSLLARNKLFEEKVPCMGPVYRDMKVAGNKIILTFDHAESGLVCSGDKLKGFRISAHNRKFVDAEAVIVGQTVELSSPEIDLPAAASYGWANYMDVNLYNGDGLPAVPFKTDRYL